MTELLELALLDVLESVVEAAYSRKKRPLLERANQSLNRTRLLTRLATDLRCITCRHQEFAAKQIENIGRQIGGWLKTQPAGAEAAVEA